MDMKVFHGQLDTPRGRLSILDRIRALLERKPLLDLRRSCNVEESYQGEPLINAI